MPGLANPQDITLLFLLDISLPICQVVRKCLPLKVVRTWGCEWTPGDCAVKS